MAKRQRAIENIKKINDVRLNSASYQKTRVMIHDLLQQGYYMETVDTTLCTETQLAAAIQLFETDFRNRLELEAQFRSQREFIPTADFIYQNIENDISISNRRFVIDKLNIDENLLEVNEVVRPLVGQSLKRLNEIQDYIIKPIPVFIS